MPPRQLSFKNSFGFDCACELYSLPSDQRQQSDQRLAKITRLNRLIGDGTGIASTPVACLHDAHALLRLPEEEGVADARIPRPYYDALQIVIANGIRREQRPSQRGHMLRGVFWRAKIAQK